MGLLDSIKTLDKPTIIIVVMGIIIAILVYLNYMRSNESSARTEECNCATEHLEVVSPTIAAKDENQNIPIPQPDEIPQAKSRLVVYYTSWCGHSKMFLDEWTKNLMPAVDSATDVKNRVLFEKIDCDENTNVCEKYKIEGYPTLLFHAADGNVHEYNGERSTEKILKFVREHM